MSSMMSGTASFSDKRASIAGNGEIGISGIGAGSSTGDDRIALSSDLPERSTGEHQSVRCQTQLRSDRIGYPSSAFVGKAKRHCWLLIVVLPHDRKVVMHLELPHEINLGQDP